MKIFVANSSKQAVGGGWTWIRNFKKSMGDLVTEDYDQADMYLIASPSMVQRDEVQIAKDKGKKIVLRCDNAVRNSRNRNTGMSRMKDFAEWADLVIFQSQWAKNYLMPFLKIDENKAGVIINGADLDIFKPGNTFQWDYANTYLYSRFNRDESKCYEIARHWFSQEHLLKPGAKLFLTGQYSNELIEGNFDFYNDESVTYLGALDEQAMADVYRRSKYLIYTFFADACSNTVIEALATGCRLVGPSYFKTTGGTPEIIKKFRENGRSYFSLERMCDEYRKILSVL